MSLVDAGALDAIIIAKLDRLTRIVRDRAELEWITWRRIPDSGQ